MKKVIITILIVITSSNIFAAGYSNPAVPEFVELVSGGVLVKGDFGDPNNCGRSNEFFYLGTEPNFDAVLSILLTALTTKKEIRFYSNTCHQVSFHHATANLNRHRYGQALFIYD